MNIPLPPARPAPQEPDRTMNTRYALLGAALAGGLVAFTLPVDQVAFGVEEGATVTKAFSTEVEFSLDDLTI